MATYPVEFVILSKEDANDLKKKGVKIYKVAYSTLTKLGISQGMGLQIGDIVAVIHPKRPKRHKIVFIEVTGSKGRR